MPGSNGLDALKAEALKQGRWRLGEDGYIEKAPFPKERTTVNVSVQGNSPDTGEALLSLTPRNGGDSPVVHYSSKAEITESDPKIDDLDNFSTCEGSLYFQVRDPTGKFESGPPVRWVAELKIRHQVDPAGDKRRLTLQSTPRAAITYSLDGSNPRDGIDYTEPFEIGPEALRLLVHARAGEANRTADFRIPASGDNRVRIDDTKPAWLRGKRVSLDTTERVYGIINKFKGNDNTLFRGVRIEIGEGENTATVRFQERAVTAGMIEGVVNSLREVLKEYEAPVAITITDGVDFENGFDVKEFARIAGLELKPGDLVQEA